MAARKMSFKRLCTVVGVSLGVFTLTRIAARTTDQRSFGLFVSFFRPCSTDIDTDTPASVYETSSHEPPQTNLPVVNKYLVSPFTTNILEDLHYALETMQKSYFSLWLGKYTTAIDWTAAVMATHVSATLASLSRSRSYTMPGTFDRSNKLDVEAQMIENEINKYFGQISSYYFGEDHFAIRMQAYDDILWVVLGWLESIQSIESHSVEHYSLDPAIPEWHARQFIPAFAHRARIFYELAEKGWDWRLCGGGMTWSAHELPYKNAITNQLWISASVSMYLHFPGDINCSPFLSQYDKIKDQKQRDPTGKLLRAQEHGDQCDEENVEGDSSYDPIYLANAINGYEWLKNSGMMNEQGLYVDGFHIAGYSANHSKTVCDERNEMVYTYNQGKDCIGLISDASIDEGLGVLLSGLRGLWEATGKQAFLEDGHELVLDVIRATGWNDEKMFASATQQPEKPNEVPVSQQDVLTNWSGLGADGILMEACDPSGTCNQNGQTFKGIFFHHLTAFCEPLPFVPVRPGKTYAASPDTRALHARSCKEYAKWVEHNAKAALQTRNERGRFGSWWGARGEHIQVKRPANATDYRNNPEEYMAWFKEKTEGQADQEDDDERLQGHDMDGDGDVDCDASSPCDLNDRGRGRTVETQSGGLAVLRAMWEFSRLAERDVDFAP